MELTPALTNTAIKRLEKSLGNRLFFCSTRSIRLTSEGEILKNYCQMGMDDFSEGINYLSMQQAEITGEIRISSPTDAGRQWISEILAQFQGIYKYG